MADDTLRLRLLDRTRIIREMRENEQLLSDEEVPLLKQMLEAIDDKEARDWLDETNGALHLLKRGEWYFETKHSRLKLVRRMLRQIKKDLGGVITFKSHCLPDGPKSTIPHFTVKVK